MLQTANSFTGTSADNVSVIHGSRWEDRVPSLAKSEVVIGFLRKTGTDTLEKQLDPFGTIASIGSSNGPL